MESSFNKDAIKEYSQAYSSKVVQDFYKEKSQITGDEIVNLTTVKQVNLFTLKFLFETWNKQMESIKSPYFDYNNDQVEEAHVRFKNILSRHILVSKEDLKPLLEHAVYDSILLIVSPYHYFDEELKKHGDNIKLDELKNARRFFKVNIAILDAIINKLEKGNTTKVFDPIDTLDAVLEETDLIPDEIADYVDQFNSIIPIDFGKIYEEVETAEDGDDENDTTENNDSSEDFEKRKKEISEEDLTPENVETSEKFIDSQVESEDFLKGGIVEEQKETEIETDKLTLTNTYNEIEPNNLNQNEEIESNTMGKIEEEIETQLETEQEEPEEEQLKTTLPENNPLLTINDTFSSEEVETLAELHHKKSVEKIETSITLNQRFMFVNGLFDGDVDTFNATIKTLDDMVSYEEAVTHMAENFDHWDSEDEDVIEFFDIVKRRFL